MSYVLNKRFFEQSLICIHTLAKGLEDKREKLGEVGHSEGGVLSQVGSRFESKAGLEPLSLQLWDARKRAKAKPGAIKGGESSRSPPTKLGPQVAAPSVHR